MNDMNNARVRISYILCALISLSLGVLIYLVFRRETYLHILLPEIIDLNFEYLREVTKESEFVSFLKYYFVDFLWGLSLSFSLLSVVNFKKISRVLFVSVVSVLWGILWEISQLTSLTKGTFDYLDILMYILAVIVAALINIFLIKRMD